MRMNEEHAFGDHSYFHNKNRDALPSDKDESSLMSASVSLADESDD